ncbi:hypothetical protein PT974_00350 [Cladobotryum mycophilum]|uniref:DUF2470 domain-containing protein n=1 Tax=Cladobotryum mycophilum TaxID=491253 RepID=A0ABR0T1Y8_9HYPO
MTTPAAPSDEERRARIINHMNREHTRELGHYLRYYASLPASAVNSSPPSLLDVTLRGMLIRTGSGKEYDVPFEPPVGAWAEVKDRIISMDTAARSALGISDVRITSYVAPQGPDWVILSGVLFYFGCVATLPFIQPGSSTWDAIHDIFPGGMGWYRWVVKALIAPVLGIHVGEMVLFDWWRMNKYGVPRWSLLWWMWEINVFCEGLGAWRRIERAADEKRAQKAAKSH